jgi:hypothetical protein
MELAEGSMVDGYQWLAQYSSGSDVSAGAVVFGLLVGGGLALIPATIASNKGYSGVGFFFFGLFLFLPALIVALVMKTKVGSRDVGQSTAPPVATPPSPPPALPSGTASLRQETGSVPPAPQQVAPPRQSAPPPGVGVVRECPSCKEPMRRDASVCPHCRRESPAWEYRDGKWWTSDASGDDVWFEDPAGLWREAGYAPPPPPQTYRVLTVSVGDAVATARLTREKGSHNFFVGEIRRATPGKVISSGLSEERASSLKESLARVGTVVELVAERAN